MGRYKKSFLFLKKLNESYQESSNISSVMDTKKLMNKLDELADMTDYMLKLTSEIRTMISVSTEVLKREPIDYKLKAQVRAKFFAKHKTGVSFKR